MSKSKIAICLYQEYLNTFDIKELIVGEKLVRVDFTGEIQYEAQLYQRKSEETRPSWVDIVSNFGDLDIDNLKSSSCGAILFLKIEDRIIGCCFGTSVANINRDNIETDFGLGVVFQKMQSSQTKVIESHSLAHNPITNIRSSTIPTTRQSFGLDRYLENISQLIGYRFKKKKRTLIKGKEFYSINSPVSIQAIVDECLRSLKDYKISVDDEDFKRLTATRRVKDSKVILELEKEFDKQLAQKSDEIHVTDYEYLDSLSGYRFTPKGDINLELTIDDLYSLKNNDVALTLQYLKRKRIYPVDSDDINITSWNVYRCLFAELDIGEDVFILFKGIWYQIDRNYLESLRTLIRDAEIDIDYIEPWDGKMDEGEFNAAVAKEINGQCWDKILYFTEEYSYGIEFCDILHDNFIYHVKKYKGSALTSHLLMQTIVSAQLLSSDPGIKSWIKKISKEEFNRKNLLIKRNGSFRHERQTYCIMLMTTREGRLSDILPFFTMITLHLTIKRVSELGFNVVVAKI